jgi:hypothetical protein
MAFDAVVLGGMVRAAREQTLGPVAVEAEIVAIPDGVIPVLGYAVRPLAGEGEQEPYDQGHEY